MHPKISTMNAARFISFWVGFISLSLEIAWVRLYGYANNSTPQAFAYVLTIYLLGIAGGAEIGKRVCRNQSHIKIRHATVIIISICSIIVAASPWIYSYSPRVALDEVLAPIAIFLTSASLSVLFPITHHLGTPENPDTKSFKKGRLFSRVYTFNVLGASAGPLITGYIIFDKFTITQIFPIFSTIAALVATTVWVAQKKFRTTAGFFSTLLALSISLCFFYYSWQHRSSLVISFSAVGGQKIVAAHENRHGIITITEDLPTKRFGETFIDHWVYGGNVYDGKVNVSLERNTNGLERPLALHALQPEAKRVLVLGLSIGSWLTVVEGFPGIELIDVIEINPGYLNLAQNYAPQKRALEDPRVNIIIDDARRWLHYHQNRKYDLILMNNTWHWRANSSMMLSIEMMALLNRHLSEKGVVAFNATGSVDAFFTAAGVFKEVRRYQNFIYGANWDPFERAGHAEAWQALKAVTIDGKPGFNKSSHKLLEYSSIPFVRLSSDLDRLKRRPETISDDNMLVEYKYGRKQ